MSDFNFEQDVHIAPETSEPPQAFEVSDETIKQLAVDYQMDQQNLKLLMSDADVADFLTKELTPQHFNQRYKEYQAKSKEFLLLQLKLSHLFHALGDRSGVHDEFCKTKIAAKVFHLSRHQREQIENLTDDMVKNAIEYADKHNVVADIKLSFKLANKAKTAEKQAKRREQKAKEFADIHRADAVILDGDVYDVIYANPPYQNHGYAKNLELSFNEIQNMHIPSAEDAILFLWMPKHNLTEGIKIAESWGFKEYEHAVWNFEEAEITNEQFCFGCQHNLLFVGIKGENFPKPSRQKNSVLNLKKDGNSKPNYYYETIERMFPKGAYLDVFAPEPVNAKWITLLSNAQFMEKNDE